MSPAKSERKQHEPDSESSPLTTRELRKVREDLERKAHLSWLKGAIFGWAGWGLAFVTGVVNLGDLIHMLRSIFKGFDK